MGTNRIEERTEAIESSEIGYMLDRMEAIRDRPGNPEGVEIARFGEAVCFYSKTMPWPGFNTVKGLRSGDADLLAAIGDFYRARGRKPQFELVPGLADPELMKRLSGLGFYQSGFHTSMALTPSEAAPGPAKPSDKLDIRLLREDEFELYATIHCRGTGLPDDGIAPVAANNRVLYGRPGWTFYLALWEGRPAGVGVAYASRGTASLTFAATLPDYRCRGVQTALLRRRVAAAREEGCALVVGQCAFLSQSHRNMERIGMRIGYVRASWQQR
ncbi:GNAT family N-acetyltransferase [Cohnella hongkongensis]|uniref:GNAT family N-acetyltransferase n=1 Tax=Cohnella hongkongensis TaxID=178337 RepID=A0ABV9FFN8_9BACL